MRLLIISSNYLPQLGGVEIVVDHLTQYLASQGHEVTLVTSRSGAGRYGQERRGEIEIHRTYLGIPGSGWKSTLVFPALAPLTFIHLRRLVQQKRPELINLHFVDNATLYAMNLARQFDLPLIVSLHGADVENLPHQRPIYGRLLQQALSRATAVTACSANLLSEAEKWSSNIGTLLKKPIPNGVEIERFTEAAPYQHPRPYLLTVARLIEKKGVDLVIRAFAQVALRWPDLDLIIAGGGSLLGQLTELAASLDVAPRVHFLGKVAPDIIPSLMNGCELFVLGSRLEPFGIVLLEAMAAGKAVVATSVGGIPEFVTYETNGLLVPPENWQALAEAINRLMANNSLREQFGQFGRQFVCEKFSWRQNGAGYEAIYQEAQKQYTRHKPDRSIGQVE